MANPIIKIKRSAVPGKIPNTTDLQLGELAINTYDGKVYIEQDQGGVGVGTTVIAINPWNVGVGSAAYNINFTAGNVGIGTTIPKAALNVVGVVSATSFVGDGSQLTGISASGGSQWITNSTGIHTLSNVGIGTTNATSRLTVGGDGIFTGVVTASSFNGSGINLSGIVTSIIAGSGVSISQSTGIVTVSVPRYGEIKILDDISGSFNGVTTSFTLSSSGGSVTPSSSQSLIINLGGVVQKPITDYYVSTNNIIFTTAPQSSLSFSAVYFNLDLLGSNANINILDDISGSFDGSTTSFSIASNGGAISPPSSQSLIISVGGVVQAPGTDYTVSGSNILFTTAPQSTLAFSGVYFNVNSADGSVTPRMLSTGGPWWNTNGNVGIGTTNPTSKLTVLGDGNFTGVVTATSFVGNLTGTVQISSGIITATSGVVTYYGDGSKLSNIISGVSISTNTTNQAQLIPYVISTGSTTGFGVTTSGLVFNPSTDNLGINTSTPTQTLHVQGNARVTGGLYDSNNNVGTAGSVLSSTGTGLSWIPAASGVSIADNTSTNSTYYVGIASISTGSLSTLNVSSSKLTFNPSTGNLVAGGTVTANSDKKIKTNVKTIENALGKVLSLRGVEYDRIDNGDSQIGVIAQEVEEIIPQVVYPKSPCPDYETKSVAYGNLIGLLIEAIKEQNLEIQKLKAKIGEK